MVSIPGLGRSLGVGNGTLFQYFCQENAMGRGAQWATTHGVAKSQKQLIFSMHAHDKFIISLVNMHHLIQMQNLKNKKKNFPCDENSQDLLSKHLSYITYIIICIMLYITYLVLISLITGSLYHLTTFLQSSFPLPLVRGKGNLFTAFDKHISDFFS